MNKVASNILIIAAMTFALAGIGIVAIIHLNGMFNPMNMAIGCFFFAISIVISKVTRGDGLVIIINILLAALSAMLVFWVIPDLPDTLSRNTALLTALLLPLSLALIMKDLIGRIKANRAKSKKNLGQEKETS